MKIIKVNIPDLKEIPAFRTLYEQQSIEELIETLKTNPQHVPIHITKDFEIINGYRMVDAIKAIGGKTVNAIIFEGNPDIHARIMLNQCRHKTSADQLREIREVFKKYPRRQGQKGSGSDSYWKNRTY